MGGVPVIMFRVPVVALLVAVLCVVLGAASAAAQNTGTIELSMIPNVGAATVKEPVHWEVMTYARDAQGRRWAVTDGVGAVKTFELPAGTYTVHGCVSGIQATHTVEVKAGAKYTYVLNLYAAHVKAVAVGKESGRAFQDTIDWTVYRADDAAAGKPPLVTVSAAQPRLLLKEGRYLIEARQDTFSGQIEVTVVPGETREIRVEMAGPAS
jgi:hypothetical protein